MCPSETVLNYFTANHSLLVHNLVPRHQILSCRLCVSQVRYAESIVFTQLKNTISTQLTSGFTVHCGSI